MATVPIGARIDEERHARLIRWMSAQPAAPTMTNVLEAAIDALLKAHPVEGEGDNS